MLNGKKGGKGAQLGKSRDRRRRNAAIAPKRAASSDFWEILGRFDRALSLIIVAHRSLVAKESADVGDEEEALGYGIKLLRNVHRELDRGAPRQKGRGRILQGPMNADS